MISWHPPEILFFIGDYPIRTYGLVLALAIFLAYSWAERRAKRQGLPYQLTNDTLFWAIIGGLVGARLAFVLQDLPAFLAAPSHIFAVWEGGLSFHGAVVGGLVGGLIYLKSQKQLGHFWDLADAASLPLLLGAIIGRFGNWANQELYGYPTDVPWAITIDQAHRLPGFEQFIAFHPTFAYEALLNVAGICILIYGTKFFIPNSKFKQPGTLFLAAIIWYSLARGTTEIWRIGDRLVGPLSFAQIISIATILLIAIFFLTNSPTFGTVDQKKKNSK